MKTLLVLLAVVLVICEGYIPEYRGSKSKRNRFVEEDSYEDDYDEGSVEETEEYSAPRTERRMRASDHEPSYGYSKSYKRRKDRDEVKTRKPSYSEKKSRSKYEDYEKSPHRTIKKDYVTRQRSAAEPVRGRKKDHRSAPVYESTYPYPSPPPPYSSSPAAVPYIKSVPVKTKCSHQILISCTPTITKVPCGAYSGGPAAPASYTPTPHAPTPHATAHHTSAQHSSAPSYHQQPSYHTPATAYTPPAYTPPAYTPPSYTAPTHAPPAAQYLPQPKPLYHHPTAQPQPEPVHQPQYQQPGQHPYYQQPKPTPHFPAPPAYHQPYQPTYKSKEPTPSYAAPVSEDNEEPPHHPVISAFPTTTPKTSHQHVPTVPADRDQHLQHADNPANRPTAGAEDEPQNQGEASGDEPEAGRRAPAPPATSTSSPTTTAATSPTTTPPPQPSTTAESEDYAQR